MRQPKPFFRKQTSSWYVEIHGKQHNLGRDEKQAWVEYHELMSSQARDAGRDDIEPILLGDMLAEFLEWTKRHRKPKTFDWYSHYVNSFGQFVGSKAAASVKPRDVEKWLDANEWIGSARRCAIIAVKRAFNWAVDDREYLAVSPIRKVKRGKPKNRERIINLAEWDQLLAAIADAEFRDLITFARETGCRPQEARAIEHRHLDLANGLIILPASEAKGERPRPIYLNDAALELVKRLAKENPTGHVFRNTRGDVWTGGAIISRWKRLREKTGIKGVCQYTIRHTFATAALVAGVDSIIVADLMGHRDTTMVARTYSHLAKNPQFLRKAANACRPPSQDSGVPAA